MSLIGPIAPAVHIVRNEVIEEVMVDTVARFSVVSYVVQRSARVIP